MTLTFDPTPCRDLTIWKTSTVSEQTILRYNARY